MTTSTILLVIALVLLAISWKRRSGASQIRVIAEGHLVQMFLVAHHLRERHQGAAQSKLVELGKLNESADRLIREQFELRPHLRADGDHERLLDLGARLCYELNNMLLISSPAEALRRMASERVTREELEQEVNGMALRRLRMRP